MNNRIMTILRSTAMVLVATACWSQDHGNCFLSRFTDSDFAPVTVSTNSVIHESGAIILDRNVLMANAIEGALQAPTPLGYHSYEGDEDLLLLKFPAVPNATEYWIYRESAAVVGDTPEASALQLYIPELEASVGIWGHIDTLPAEQMLRVAVDRVSHAESELVVASVWGVRTVQRTDTQNLLSPLSWVQIESPGTAVDPVTWSHVKHTRSRQGSDPAQ